MTVSVGFTVAACAECGCDANSYHHPGCSLAPYVCPGCHAVDERCYPGCIDSEIEAGLADALERGDYEPVDLNDVEDWEYAP